MLPWNLLLLVVQCYQRKLCFFFFLFFFRFCICFSPFLRISPTKFWKPFLFFPSLLLIDISHFGSAYQCNHNKDHGSPFVTSPAAASLVSIQRGISTLISCTVIEMLFHSTCFSVITPGLVTHVWAASKAPFADNFKQCSEEATFGCRALVSLTSRNFNPSWHQSRWSAPRSELEWVAGSAAAAPW